MALIEKVELMDDERISKTLTRMAHEIVEHNKNIEDLVIIGIRRRGVPLADRIAALIEDIEGKKVRVGYLDITLYRDDLTLLSQQPILHRTEVPFSLDDKRVILVDDVLYTGRTVRSALDALMDLGRPKSVLLAVLVDRGLRELPIKADFVGKFVPTSENEVISVEVKDIDTVDRVVILEKNE